MASIDEKTRIVVRHSRQNWNMYGDMVANRYSQRGICAAIIPEIDIPYEPSLHEQSDNNDKNDRMK